MNNLNTIYTTKSTKVQSKPGCWDVLEVEVLKDGQVIGNYKRDYHTFYRTFYAFEHKSKHYALYSSHYGETSLMSLPDCKHLCSTKSGFCPVDFYVPDFAYSKKWLEFSEDYLQREIEKTNPDPEKIAREKKSIDIYNYQLSLAGTLGIVAGCYWGDDSGGCDYGGGSSD